MIFSIVRSRFLGFGLLVAIFAGALTSCSSSGRRETRPIEYNGPGSVLPYTSAQLMLKDLDDMTRLTQLRIRRAKSGREDAGAALREALRVIYARPNEDFLTEKLIGDVRNELEEIDEWENSISDLAYEAAARIANPRDLKPAVQLTYVLILENLLADLKPLAKTAWVRKIIIDIRDANLNLTPEASRERAMKMMKEAIDPSTIAAKIIPYED